MLTDRQMDRQTVIINTQAGVAYSINVNPFQINFL